MKGDDDEYNRGVGVWLYDIAIGRYLRGLGATGDGIGPYGSGPGQSWVASPRGIGPGGKGGVGYWSGRGATPETAVQLKEVVVKPWHAPMALATSDQPALLNTSELLFTAVALPLEVSVGLIWEAVIAQHNSTSPIAFSRLGNAARAAVITRSLGTGGVRMLRAARFLGGVATFVGLANAVLTVRGNPTAGNYTRLAVQGIAIGAAAFPGVGWALSAGITAADLIWGDQLYEWIDR